MKDQPSSETPSGTLKRTGSQQSGSESKPRAQAPDREPQGNGSGGRWLSKEVARSGLRRVQQFIGVAFLLSAFAGSYMLATDGSLWLLAVSHAVGLVVIVLMDTALGIMNLLSSKRAYLPSLAAAFLGLLLQLGDIFTAPQYNMTMSYFARYLFGLWAFDLLLALQVSVIGFGVFGRGYARYLARRKSRRGRELSYSRRGFVKAIAALAGMIGVAVALGSVKLPAPSAASSPSPSSQSSQASQTSQASGAIANTKNLNADSPVYFEYPKGYPNMLLKKADGSLVALSMLCTHVCCQVVYASSANEIYCPCHGSVFSQDGSVLRGPAYQPLPQVELRVDTAGNVFPVKMTGSSPCIQA